MKPRAVAPPITGDARALPAAWHERAGELRKYGALEAAAALERCAIELEDAIRASDGAALTLREAAAEAGLSTDHVGRLVRDGLLTNAGRPHAPRVLRSELAQRAALPRKARALRSAPLNAKSRVQIARSVAEHSGKGDSR